MATSAPGPGMPTLMTRGPLAGSASAGSKFANSPSGSSTMPSASGWAEPETCPSGGCAAGWLAARCMAAAAAAPSGSGAEPASGAAAPPDALCVAPASAAVLALLTGGRESAVFPDAG